jgi:hypothetical protein
VDDLQAERLGMELRNAAYIYAQATAALIEAMGYKATNDTCAMSGRSPVRREADFKKLIDVYGLHHNALCTLQQGL